MTTTSLSSVSAGNRVRGVTPGRQLRSRATLERIMDATERLLDGRDFANIPVSEICAEAEVSDSSFYARFDSKDALLRSLHDRHVQRRYSVLADFAEGTDWNALEVRDVVRACMSKYLDDRVRNGPLLHTLGLAQLQHSSLRDQRSRLDLDALRLVENYFCKRLGSDSERLRKRIRFATLAAVATLHDAIARPRAFAEQFRLAHDEILDECAEQWIRYVDRLEDEA